MTSPEVAASIQRLRSTFEAAMDFGLTDEECWSAAKEVAFRTPEEKPALPGAHKSRTIAVDTQRLPASDRATGDSVLSRLQVG
jgi:hypothetical protein